MGEGTDSIPPEGEVNYLLREILSQANNWLDYLLSQAKMQAAVTAVLSTLGVWSILFLLVILVDYLAGQVLEARQLLGTILLFGTGAISIAAGVLTYIIAKKRYSKEYVAWKTAVSQLADREKTLSKPGQLEETKGEYQSTLETAMRLMDQVNVWLPTIRSRRLNAALFYGAAAFVVSVLISRNTAIALLIAVSVWLYFRFERRMDLNREIRRAEKRRAMFRRHMEEISRSL